MERYRLFDSGCSLCTSLAHKAEKNANGQLTASRPAACATLM